MLKNSIPHFGHKNGFHILANHALCQAAAKQTCIGASLQFSSAQLRTTMGQLGHKHSLQKTSDQAVKTTFHRGDSKDDHLLERIGRKHQDLKSLWAGGWCWGLNICSSGWDVFWAVCLLSLTERGCGPFYCAISPKQHADNVRNIEAAARTRIQDIIWTWSAATGPNIYFSGSNGPQ